MIAVLDRTASAVCWSEVTIDDLDTRRTIGSTTKRSAAGISRLRAIASSSMYTPPSRSLYQPRTKLYRLQMMPIPWPSGSMCSEGLP